MIKPKKITPSEYEEQKALVEWLELTKHTFSAIPHATWTSSWKQKNINKATGVRSGVPDMIVILKTKVPHLCFIELKRVKGGVISGTQKAWIKELNECDGVYAKVCRGWIEATNYIELLEREL